MLGKHVPDKELSKTINRKLVRISAPVKVTADVSRGTVTMTGQLRYDQERKQIVKAVSAIPGVDQLIDQMKSPPKKPVG